jgi:hypothetical protein
MKKSLATNVGSMCLLGENCRNPGKLVDLFYPIGVGERLGDFALVDTVEGIS